jgi:hypothetical protein
MAAPEMQQTSQALIYVNGKETTMNTQQRFDSTQSSQNHQWTLNHWALFEKQQQLEIEAAIAALGRGPALEEFTDERRRHA